MAQTEKPERFHKEVERSAGESRKRPGERATAKGVFLSGVQDWGSRGLGVARAPIGAACTPRRKGKQRTSTRPGKLLPRRAPRSLERKRRRRRQPRPGA